MSPFAPLAAVAAPVLPPPAAHAAHAVHAAPAPPLARALVVLTLLAVPTVAVLVLGGLAVVLIAVVGWLGWVGARLAMARRRAAASRVRLDAALACRAAEALALAASGRLDPADAVRLTDAAHEARAAADGTRDRCEGDLADLVRVVTTRGVGTAEDPDLGGLGGLIDPLVADLTAADLVVALASADHDENLAVAARRRGRRPARWLPAGLPLPAPAPPGATPGATPAGAADVPS